jgi:RecA/RadA recombinase
MAKDTTKSSDDKIQAIFKDILKDKSGHFNHIIPTKYYTSTGSLNLDLEMGGGIKNSIIRIAGESETGKTSFTLNVIKNFLECKEKRRRGVYFVSDKDLSENLIKRCGVKFVTDIEDFKDGTCFLLRTNVYETVCNSIKRLLEGNTEDVQFIFALDSMDNFAPRAALEVEYGESFQKGGTSAISSHFFRSYSVLLPLLGHTTVLVSQFRDTFNMGKGPQIHKQMSSSGGRATEHAVSWAFEFLPALNSKEDMFWDGEPYKSKKLGHNCIIQFRKTTNEKTGAKVKYPILYGRENGNSIWVEKEIFDQLLIFGMVIQKGAWFAFQPDIHAEIAKIDSEIPKQIQGGDNFVKYLESKSKVTEYLYEKFRKIVMQ